MRLSICIPTHHGRCALLESALESIAGQVTDELPMDVEIVVSDNASQDGTDALVSRFRSRHPGCRLIYGRNDRDLRLGNILKAVERATGDWCWLFGSDDIMAEDGLSQVTRAIARFPEATGIGFGKANFTHDMTARIHQDAPEFFPEATEATLYEGYEQVLRQLAFQFAFLGTTVVQRGRWLAAAERVGESAVRRHPNWPQLVVLAEMARRDPTWVWLPCMLVKARAGRPYLVEQDGGAPDLARMHAMLVDGLRRVWPEVAGRDTPLHRALLQKSYACAGSDVVVRNIKMAEDQTISRDLLLLRSFTYAFWRLPRFRRHCLPLLLVPAALGRIARARRRPPPMTRLAPDEIATRVIVALPGRLRPRETVRLRCILTNLGTRVLRWSHPYPVALGFRWVDAATGATVMEDDRTPLPRPVALGESLELESRVNTPWEAGAYELQVSPVQELVAWFDDLDPANGASFRLDLLSPGLECGSAAQSQP